LTLDLSSYGYLIALVVSICGLVALDHRHKLAIWVSPLATVFSVFLAVAFFLAWDIVGIANGIFFRGITPFLSGVLLAPELPLEEVFFLILLSYNTLLFYAFFERRAK
jgi:lycopene cyclase domain-containing protein